MGREHVASEIPSRSVASQFVVGAVDAISIEGRISAGRAEKGVIGENLFLAQASIVAKCSFVRLEGVLAAQSLGKEVRCEIEKSSAGRIEAVGTGISCHDCANGCQGRLQPDVRRDRDAGHRVRLQRNKRFSDEKSRTDEELVPNSAQDTAKVRVAGLYEG